MMLAVASALLVNLVLLHPGHSTRVELQWNGQTRCLELAMRIDHADLEAALRKRWRQPIRTDELTADQAKRWIGTYLRETLRIDGTKLAPEHFVWVGWERKRIASWVYVELLPTAGGGESVSLEILSLLEVEPELNHVVTIRRGSEQKSVVLSKAKPLARVATED